MTLAPASGEEETEMTFAEALAHTERICSRCVLCSRLASWRGVFVPNEPRLWPGGVVASGKTRGLFYGICRRCRRRPDLADAVESRILLSSVGHETRH